MPYYITLHRRVNQDKRSQAASGLKQSTPIYIPQARPVFGYRTRLFVALDANSIDRNNCKLSTSPCKNTQFGRRMGTFGPLMSVERGARQPLNRGNFADFRTVNGLVFFLTLFVNFLAVVRPIEYKVGEKLIHLH